MTDEVTGRVLQLIDFLGAYDAQRNPPIRDVTATSTFVFHEAALPDADGVRLTPTGDTWLTVDFVGLPPRPAVPDELSPVLGDGSALDPDQRPVVESGAADDDPGDDTADDDPADGTTDASGAGSLVDQAEQWISDCWEPWAAHYRSARLVKTLYRDLFEQRELLTADRETYEVIWGFGRVRHTTEQGERIDHPLISVPVEIDADLASGRLQVRPAGPLMVEGFFLAGLDLDDRAGFTTLSSKVAEDEAPIDPWQETARRDLLRGLLRTIDHDGGIRGESAVEPGRFALDDAWVLHLRRRRPDYQGFLDELRRLYRSGSVPPDPLKAIVIDAPSTLIRSNDEAGVDQPDGTGDRSGDAQLLLPLPYNAEQQRIVALASERPGVTVQGPPGTGKSHTIANIISHYVAHGQRVLVVAEKEQALRVLADKVPSGIRDLTVSVLGADDEGRRQLESSIAQIQSRVTGFDRVDADRRIERLETRLAELDIEAAELDATLLSVRRSEVAPLPGRWEAGTDPTPATIASWLAANEADLGRIDDPVDLERDLPLDNGTWAELLDLFDEVGMGQARRCAAARPDPTRLPSGTGLAQLLAAEAEVDARVDALGDSSDALGLSWETVDGLPEQQASEIGEVLRAEFDWRTKIAGSWVDRLIAEVADPILREQWHTFADECERLREHLSGRQQLIEAHEVEVPVDAEPELTEELRQIGRRMFTKGRLGMGPAGSRRKRTLARCRVDGRPPATPDEVDLCVARLEIESDRRALSTRWRNRMDLIDGPSIDGDRPEAAIAADLADIERALGAERRWRDLRVQVERFGISAPVDAGPDELGRLVEVLDAVVFRQKRLQAIETREALVGYLEAGRSADDASPLWADLARALLAQDPLEWDRLRSEVEHLAGLAPQADRLLELHDRLHRRVPVWAGRLAEDPGARVGRDDFERAWQWRRLETWLVAVHRLGEPAAIQHRIEEVADERRVVVEDLVAGRAWRRLADRIGDRERQALNSYLQAVKRYGRTGGKFAARWLAQIRAALNDSKDAVPVWIMPTNRALSSFRPDAEPRFDVLVIDEASQLGHEALPLLALARTTIVVGDDKQTSPENVGLEREPVFKLLEQYLTEIPAYKTLFDPDASLYDLAFQKFPDVIMLTEHFRSLPEIIRFSNEHAYDDLIVPLRDRAPAPGWQAVGAIRVADATRQGDLNRVEAEAVVELIVGACADPAYEGMTFGVISMLGKAQSGYIWRRLFDELGPEAMAARRIRCGEPAGFQGDERDVVVVSMVVALDPDDPDGRIGAMTTRAAERRINVAASRARNQLWVVHSVDADRFPPGDLRAELIRHGHTSKAVVSAAEGVDPVQRCRTSFQRTVLAALVERGYRRIHVDYQVGRHHIDLVVEDDNARLAIVCDDDSWPGEEIWRADHERQRVLERAGWSFERIRASAFNRHPASALDPLWARLERLAIDVDRPGGGANRQRRTKARAAETLADGRRGSSRGSRRSVAEEAKTRDDGHPTMAPYREWVAWKVTSVAEANDEELLDGLIDIVEVEGPILVDRLVRTYLAASGTKRVTAQMRAALEQAVEQAIDIGDLAAVADGTTGANQTVHLAGRPPVAVRRLGPRGIDEVPRSELHRLIVDLDRGLLAEAGEARQAVRRALGLNRLAGRAAGWVDDCLDSRWDVAEPS